MASLVDTLIETLNSENEEYKQLLELSNSKTDVIVRGDLDNLTLITEKEQEIVGKINSLETMRMKTMKEIARILNTDVEILKLETLVSLLKKTPREQKELAEVHDKLHTTLYAMKMVNERNGELLKSAREMVDFNMTLLQSMRKAPETANYNSGAYNTGAVLGTGAGSFDAKQ